MEWRDQGAVLAVRRHGETAAIIEVFTAAHGRHAGVLAYLRWELLLLEDLGFGLDLARCAVTGQTGDLAFVSPRTGRAVSRAGAGTWADRLLPLPPCLTGGDVTPAGLLQGLYLTGHFLTRELGSAPGTRPLPEARARLVGLLARSV